MLLVGVDDMNALFGWKAKLCLELLQSGVAKKQSDLSLTPRDESWQHFPASTDPSAQLCRGCGPVPLVDPPS